MAATWATLMPGISWVMRRTCSGLSWILAGAGAASAEEVAAEVAEEGRSDREDVLARRTLEREGRKEERKGGRAKAKDEAVVEKFV